MKRWICAGIAAMLLVSTLTACDLPFGTENEEASSAVSSAVVSEVTVSEPYHMGLLQFTDTPMEEELREAFFSRLEEWGYDETRLTVDYQSANGSEEEVEKFCKQFAEDGAQVVVVLSADAVERVEKTVGQDVAVIAIGDEVQLKSGVQQTLTLALQIDPNLKSLGLLDDGLHDETKQEVEVYCEAHEIELVVTNYTDGEENSITKAMDELTGKVSTIYTLPGAVSKAQAEEFATAAKDRALAWYAGDFFLVQKGALAAVTSDLTQAGYELADQMISAMLGQAEEVQTVAEADKTAINRSTASVLGVDVPDEILETAVIVSDSGT